MADFLCLFKDQRNKDGKSKIVSTNDENVIDNTTSWLNGDQMFKGVYEAVLAID